MQRHAGSHIKTLLNDLRDVMYDADDIIDTCTMEGGKLLGVERPSPLWLVCSEPFKIIYSCFRCLKYRHEIGADIKKLRERIDDIVKHNQIMVPFRISAGSQSIGNGSRKRVVSAAGETSHLQDVTRVVGSQIEEAATKLIKCILDSNGKEKYRLIAITGMGGIGKTTLARKVFNDEIVTSNFHATDNNTTSSDYFLSRRIWLHVSKDYYVADLLKEMVRNLGGGSDEGLRSRAELDSKLVSLLPESLFLVLDDVWIADVWNEIFRSPLAKIKQNIVVLVTTRDEKVARSLRASYIHRVERMDNDSCWELLRREVFMDTNKDEIHSLEEVGYQIIKKCNGLPLAVKAIAGVLKPRDKNVTEWDKVARSAIWSMDQMDGEVPRALYLSYEDLLPGQRQCFVYCSFLSQNGPMYMEDVVAYLVDEGLVPPNNGQQSVEEVVENWYQELIWRNLLQLHPSSIDGSKCTMHDLLKSFGLSLMEEGICIRDQTQIVRTRSLMKLRRLLMMSNTEEMLKLPECVTEPERLRVIFLRESYQIKSIGEGLIGKLCNLRILMLRDANIEELPRSIGELFHLRHLNLDGTRIKEIPDSIGDLSNLQTLRASRCQFLYQLPNTVTRLLKLRLLNLRDTPFNHVPQGIGKLHDLHTLAGLTIGHDHPEWISKKGEKCCDLDEIQHLCNLKDLGLHKLHRSIIGGKAGSALADKSFLRRLELSAAAATSLRQEQIESTKFIYDGLTLPRNLQMLSFDSYPCLEFPKWLMPPPSSSSLADSFPNLRFLRFRNVKSCKELPPQLSWLPQLKYLRVSSADAITTIGPQFFSCRPRAVAAFPKLEILEFVQMPNWEEWSSSSVDGREEVDQAGGSGSTMVKKQLLPRLIRLMIFYCPVLKALPRCLSLATNLQKLWIAGASGLRKIDNLPLSDEMRLVDCGLKELCNLPSLRFLYMVNCPELKTVRNLPALKHLSANVKQLPGWLPELALQPGFKKLDIYCPRELFIEYRMNYPQWGFMHHIGKDVTVRFLRPSK